MRHTNRSYKEANQARAMLLRKHKKKRLASHECAFFEFEKITRAIVNFYYISIHYFSFSTLRQEALK